MSLNQNEFISLEPGKFKVTSDLTFSSVSKVWNQAMKPLVETEEKTLEIDIASAHNLDSSGLALLVAWTRWSHCNNKTLTFCNASEKVKKLVEINKLQDVLLFN